MEKLEKKKNHCSHHIKHTIFYVFWLAEAKFVMKKEVWQPGFGDNLKKLSKSRVSVEKLEKKKKHCFHHIKNKLFYVFWLAEYQFLMEKEVWQPSYGDKLKKLWKSRVPVKKLKKKKKIVSITLKTLYFYVFWLGESKFGMEKEV